jgi:hypothetical protein
MDRQRETAFATLEGLSEEQLWQRPSEKAWSIGEILSHTYLLTSSSLPYVRFAWRWFRPIAERRRHHPFRVDMPDRYRNGNFPMWVGFLWTPRYNAAKHIPRDQLVQQLKDHHTEIRRFYEGKPEDLLGHVYLWDPYFGLLNLIETLRLGMYHDQLHYEDVIRQAEALKVSRPAG